jgi:hypothetical protein
MIEDSYVVLVQVGYQKSAGRRAGQLVKAFVCFKNGGEEEIQWSNDPEKGKYLTDRSHRDMCWYMANYRLSDGDQLRFDIFTGQRGVGEDPHLTQKRLMLLDANLPVREFTVPHVGFRRFPLAKGRLTETTVISKRDEIERELCDYIDDEKNM